jgi:arsenate reductase
LAVAEDLGVDVNVVKYINDPPDEALLRRIVDGLEDPVEDLVRKDSQFKKLELNADDYVGNANAVVAVLAERKQLIQRPVVIKGDIEGTGKLQAIIGRPKDRIGPFITS